MTNPIARKVKLLVITLLAACSLTGCAGLGSMKTTTGTAFERRYGKDFSYVEVDAVRQISERSCGAAALACVLQYWEKPVSAQELVERYPMQGSIGYPILQLRSMAQKEGLLAFAQTIGEQPVEKLNAQLNKGRPVIIAVECPYGRYFGKPVPVIESFDSRSVWNVGQRWKAHYLVVCGVSEDEYLVMDPAYGIVRVAKLQLLEFWSRTRHAALVCASG
ncbi:MAG: ABC-type bacteriocin/lantibiotic exporter with double-glycine peptidase domain [Verrucomicrobiales bacterium]|jgi:ABC-type bacteriocin/lantibiotic exporter with double-glycine peptidase domain